jgi:acyl-CoA thioester hydrolase
MSEPFLHRVRPRYAEVDAQGVVFNAHWLTYFDEASTRFFDWLGFPPATAFFEDFDLMIVKAVLDWQGPAGFDEEVDIAVEPVHFGTSSFDVRYTATVGDRPVCVGVITYVSVRPGRHESTPIPDDVRAKLTGASNLDPA